MKEMALSEHKRPLEGSARSRIAKLSTCFEAAIQNDVDIPQCGKAVANLLQECLNSVSSKPLLAKEHAGKLIELARQKFYTYSDGNVPLCWRQLYTDASICKAFAIAASVNDSEESDFKALVETLDLALIMTGAPGTGRILVIEDMLHILDDATPYDSCSFAKNKLEAHVYKSVDFPCEAVDDPTMEEYLSLVNFPSKQVRPFVIKNIISHWPALTTRPWADPNYLLSVTHRGRRMVPIELGRTYTDDDWGQSLLPFSEFLEQYILDPDPALKRQGYLAQHDLFRQIHKLRRDIQIPDFCHYEHPSYSLKDGIRYNLQEPILNAWFGPRGTISALHHDPYHNILAQIVGHKYVRLYSGELSEKLYPKSNNKSNHGGIDMSNTSQVDVDNVDDEQFPEFRNCEYLEAVLGPGDCLYIPPGWWHYVKSLSTSFSVSFWFT